MTGRSLQEFLLPLEDVFAYPDPEKTVADFFSSGFDLIQKLTPWEGLEWTTSPLEYPGQ